MKRRNTLITLILIGIVGSFINFYATNLLMNVVSDKDMPNLFFVELLTPLPAFIIACMFVIAAFYVFRLYLHPTHMKKMTWVYGIILASMSVVGIICISLSGPLVYGSFTKPYPFAGYHILVLIFNILTLTLGMLMIFYFPRLVKDPDIILHKMNWKRVVSSILLALLIYYTFNRFGAFLWSPSYILWRTLDDTYPFYLSLVLLMALLIHILLYVLNYYRAHSIGGIAVSSGIIVLSFFFFIQIVVRGIQDQSFISSISPAVPIERLLTFPYDIIINFIVVVGLGAFTLANSIVFKRLRDKENAPKLSIAKKKNK